MDGEEKRKETALLQAIEAIQSDSATTRKEGLKESKRILDDYLQSSGFAGSKRLTLQDLFDAIFRATIAERNAYNKSSAKNSTRAIMSSIELCASVFRTAIEATYTSIRSKTLKAILGHVTQALTISEGSFCTPLVPDYVRGLAFMLKFKPHVEHLSASDWEAAINLCITGLQFYNSNSHRQKPMKRSFAASQPTDIASDSSSFNKTWQNTVANTNIIRAEFMNCLFYLVSTSSKPVPKKAREILTMGFEMLRDISQSSNVTLPSLGVIKAVFGRILTTDLATSWDALENFLSVAPKFLQITEHLIWDEVLAILVQLQPFLRKAIGSDLGRRINTHVEGLLSRMWKEYLKPPKQSSNRGHLKIAHLQLHQLNYDVSSATPFEMPAIRLRRPSPWTVSAWTTLYFIAFFHVWIDNQKRSGGHANGSSAVQSPSKRLKLSNGIDELLKYAVNGSTVEECSCSLQVLLFALNQLSIPPEELSSTLESLSRCAAGREVEISAWAMLCISSLSFQQASTHGELESLWKLVWRNAMRQLYSVTQSRAVCHTLCSLLVNELVNLDELEEDLRSILPYGAGSGLPSASDASLALSCVVMDRLRKRNPGLVDKGDRGRWLLWLLAKWAPSKLEDRSHLHQLSTSFPFSEVLLILSTSASQNPLKRMICLEAENSGGLSETWRTYFQSVDALEYVLLTEKDSKAPQKKSYSMPLEIWDMALNLFTNLHDSTLLRFLIQEMQNIEQFLSENLENRPTFMTKDISFIVSHFSFACEIITSQWSSSYSGLIEELRSRTKNLCSLLFTAQASASDPKDVLESFLEAAQGVPFYIGNSKDLNKPRTDRAEPELIISVILKGYERIKEMQEYVSQETSFFSDDFDTGFDSQPRSLKQKSDNVLVVWDPAHNWILSPFHTSIVLFLQLLATSQGTVGEHRESPSLLKLYAKRILQCSQAEILATHPLLQMILNQKFYSHDDSQSLSMLLGHLSDNILRVYDLERSELSMRMCLDIMSVATDLWVNSDVKELANINADLYDWFVSLLEKKSLLSPRIQMCISDMLFSVIQTDPDFPHETSSLSAKQSILSLLYNAEIIVQYSIIRNLPLLLGDDGSGSRDVMFEQIHENLPKNLDYTEGISIRLLGLSRLGVFDRSLLRRCSYYILETAGNSQDAVPHATWCLKQIASQLAMPDAKELFKLFRSQIVHSWVIASYSDSDHSLSSVPFAIFGYGNLRELLVDAQEEMATQLIGSKDRQITKDFEATINSTCAHIINNEAFSQGLAYAYLQDASESKGSSGYSSNCEAAVREALGKSRLNALLVKYYPYVLAQMFRRFDQEDGMEKALSGGESYGASLSALRDMDPAQKHSVVLPSSQPPAFRPRTFIAAMEKLGRRINKDMTSIWTHGVVLVTIRVLLDELHDKLGSSHSLRIVLRLKILISLCGKLATTGYILQRLLQALRPFLLDQVCAPEAIGIIRYLLSRGRTYLERHPGFLAGYCVATLLSLQISGDVESKLLLQKDDHAKSETEHLAVRDWFSQYVHSCQPNIEQSSLRSFRTITTLACKVSTAGSAKRGRAESELLLALLADCQADNRLLEGSNLQTCLRLLLHNFEAPKSFMDDILGSSKDSYTFITAIWDICQLDGLNKTFKAWAARVLGRGYSFRGSIPQSALRDTNVDLFQNSASEGRKTRPSSAAMFDKLVLLLLSEDSYVVSLSEQAIGHILTSKSEEIANSGLHVPQSISTALSGRISGLRNEPNTGLSLNGLPEHRSRTLGRSDPEWIRQFALDLALRGQGSVFLAALMPLLQASTSLAAEYFPHVVHLCLLSRWGSNDATRKEVSERFRWCFDNPDSILKDHLRLLVNTVLYMRSQVFPGEQTDADRNSWLDIDYTTAAHAAVKCGMLKSSLLLVELTQTKTVSDLARVNIASNYQGPSDSLLLSIFTKIEEPDAYYGVQKPSDLNSLAERFEYEESGIDTLLLRGMQNDLRLRHDQLKQNMFADGVVAALANLNLNGMTYQSLSSHDFLKADSRSSKSMYKAALRLGRWDLATDHDPQNRGVFGSIYSTFKTINTTGQSAYPESPIDDNLLDVMGRAINTRLNGQDTVEAFAGLAALTEVRDVRNCKVIGETTDFLDRMRSSVSWMSLADVNEVAPILIARETLFSQAREILMPNLALSLENPANILFEAEVMLLSSRIYREQRALEEALGRVTYLSDLSARGLTVGCNITDAVVFETANVLEARDQSLPAIRMLSTLLQNSNFDDQAVYLGKAHVLATLGRQTATARLEKSEDVLNNYLVPALSELPANDIGDEVSTVHHEYAAYCHSQLESPDFAMEFNRSEKFRDRKEAELKELDKIISTSKDTQQVHQAKSDRSKTKMWLQIDHNEYERLQRDKQTFLEKSLEHYLVSLAASDNYKVDMLRFVSIWLANYHNTGANVVVAKAISKVPSRKFVPVMNQLASRLQDATDAFQASLWDLVRAVCNKHPYHGIHHIFAGSKTTGGSDKNAISRNSAATKIANELYQSGSVREIFRSLYKSNDLYVALARMRAPNKEEQKKTLNMQSYQQTQRMEKYVPLLKVPPITMGVEVREDCDYSGIVVVTGFKSELTIASGLSAPKIVTALGSNGVSYKQLYKAGNDDLRQDAIMEQVFEEATGILNRTRATRQRHLRIRTYRVMPLTATSGVIEFVPNSIVLNDWLMPAHARYNPDDLTWSTCRQKTSDATKMPQSSRIKVFQDICSRFNPVLRYFFFEYFKDPSDWFAKRLAYTRSTAAISMLGHALGLGDRHCQNILLDSQTGDVIHIDLGVAFEAGRILAVPEVVPFRLTRDIVNGFGIMKTEGVFRRCCEFTLEALRENKDVIITLLNVLRYDPLHSWSVSPLRAKRLREEQEREMAGAPDNGSASSSTATRSRRSMNVIDQENRSAEEKRKKREAEEGGGEADRALAVVEKKLSKGLSVQATVNELIQQASDERNLALLFCGWAAFA